MSVGKFNVAGQCLGGPLDDNGTHRWREPSFCTITFDQDMVQTLREEIDRVNPEIYENDSPIIRNFRECLDLEVDTDNELAGYSGSFAACILTSTDEDDGREFKNLFISMNRAARLDLAEFIEDLNSPVGAVNAMVHALRHPGDKLTPRQKQQVRRSLHRSI